MIYTGVAYILLFKFDLARNFINLFLIKSIYKEKKL